MEPDQKTSDPFRDPYMRVEGGMASTEVYTLWSSLMPVFAEMTRLDYFKAEIQSGNKQHKDFYVNFRQNLLEKFDNAVADSPICNRFGGNEQQNPLGLKYWRELPWDIRVKTYLTLYAVEIEAQ